MKHRTPRFWMLGCLGSAFWALVVGSVGGCAHTGPQSRMDFSREVDKIRTGMSETEVRSRLGDPDHTREGAVALHPEHVPTVNLASYAPVGTPYKEWDYKRSDSRYHVFLVPDATRGGWQVLTVTANTAGAE